MLRDALTTPEKSPPGLIQRLLPVNRLVQVASPAVAGEPPWSVLFPSPQDACTRRRSKNELGPPAGVAVMLNVKVTELTVEPAGTLLLKSNRNKPRAAPPFRRPPA